jgi:hypothetical protein
VLCRADGDDDLKFWLVHVQSGNQKLVTFNTFTALRSVVDIRIDVRERSLPDAQREPRA